MKKLFSRKFLITIGGLVALFEGKQLTTLHLVIIAAVVAAYVIAETVLDHKGMPSVSDELEAAAGTVINTIVQGGGPKEAAAAAVKTTLDIALSDEAKEALEAGKLDLGSASGLVPKDSAPKTIRTFPDVPEQPDFYVERTLELVPPPPRVPEDLASMPLNNKPDGAA